MLRSFLVGFLAVATVFMVAKGIVLAQTPTPTPTPTPTATPSPTPSELPSGAPKTGFGW